MKKRFLRKVTSLIVAVSVAFSAIGALTVSADSEIGSVGDGHAYLYFAADSLDVESPENCKVAYQVNDGDLVYLTSNFIAKWVRIDKSALETSSTNKITLYTGDANGILNESLSRTDAGTGCCDYVLQTDKLALVLPNGKVLETPTITTYTPKDADTALNTENIAATTTDTRVSIGDDTVDKPYKVELVFDSTAWDGSADPQPAEIPSLKNVSLQIGAAPDERRFVWYSTSTKTGYVEITPSANLVNGTMPESAQRVEAASSVSGDTDYYSFHAAISNLSKNTEYAYRVGNEDSWSSVYTFKTDDFEIPYSFIAGGDIQLGQLQDQDTVQAEIDGWFDTLNKITTLNPDASFFLALGDQVSDAHIESQYNGLFAPTQMTSIPFAFVQGNHDFQYVWEKHYNVPNPTAYGVGRGNACDYSYVYGDTLFMHVNSNVNTPDEHLTFVEETMMKYPDVTWRVVIMHHAFFGASLQNMDDWELRNQLAPAFSRLGIDVVLDGHQHCYCRSKMMVGTEPDDTRDYTTIKEVVNPGVNEVLYVTLNSSSGSAYVAAKGEGGHIALKNQEKIPNISNVAVTEDSFAITTYRTSDMTVVDEFTIKREGSDPVAKSVLVSPKAVRVTSGYSQQFTAEVFGYNNPTKEVKWSVSGNESDKTTISSDGLLSIDINETAEKLTVTAASVINEEISYSAEVTVTGNARLVNEDFQGGEEGTTIITADGTVSEWNGWRISTSGNRTYDTVISLEKEKYSSEDRLTDNMVAKIERTRTPDSTSQNIQLAKDVTPFTGGIISTKFRVARNENAATFSVVFESKYTVDTAVKTATSSYNFMLADGRISSEGISKTKFLGGDPAETDKWYDFEILIDVDNDKSYVYCDGKLVASGAAGSDNASESYDAAKDIYGLSAVHFKSDRTTGATAAGGCFWLDDICVKNITAEDAVRQAAKKTADDLKGRISADTITLPTSGYYNTTISWTSSDTSVIDTSTGVVTRPQSGEPVSVTLTATAVNGTDSYSCDIPVLVNPQSVIFDEGFEQPRSFNGQALDGINSWERAFADTTEGRIIDSVFTVVDDTADNKALSLARLAGVSDQSKEYVLLKALPEVLNNTKASLKFRIKRTSDASGQVALYLYNSDKSQVLKTAVKLSDCSILFGDKQMFFDGGSAHAAEKDAWYNFEMLFDLENGICTLSEGDVICDVASITELSEIAYIGISTERADAAISSSETYVDDIIFNKLTDIVTSINVGQGVTYKLPEAIGNVAVTWKNAAGETVTNADTENVGYRLYTGILADNSTVTYRVNVGEYKELMRDDFEAYTEDQYTTAITKTITGGKFTKYKYVANDNNDGQRLVEDGENTVLALGPYSNKWGRVRWTPDDKAAGEAFKISVKLKVVDFDPSASSNTTNNFVQLRPQDINGVNFQAKTGSGAIETRVQNASTSDYEKVDVTWENSSGKYSMTDYIELSIEGNDIQYSTFLGDTELADSQGWSVGTNGGLSAIDVAKRDTAAATNAITYIDELVYSKAVYVTDTLKNQSVEATITQGAASAQTATVTLNMSDDTKKDFTVKYTVDTSATGVQNVKGTIDGFDGTIPVTVTVKNVITGITSTDTGIEKATIQKVGNITSGVAVFAYYGSDHKFAKAKSVPFAESDFTDGVAELNVGLVFPEGAEGGYIKGFVFENLTSLIPLDVVFPAAISN